VVLLFAVLASLVLSRAGLQVGYLTLLPLVFWAAVWLVQGPAVARASAFGIGYLYFAIPVWGYLNDVAQETTVIAVRFLLKITGVTAYVVGNVVQIPEGTFEIEGGCSGLHFVVVALAIGALLGEIRREDWRGRLRWLAIALVLAVVTNWIRVYTIILLGHLTDMQHYIVRVSHYGYGWALFAAAMAILLLIEYRAPMRVAVEPVANQPASSTPLAWKMAAVAVILLPAILGFVIDARTSSVAAQAKAARDPACWATVGGISSWSPVQRGADRIERRRLRCGGVEIESFTAFYHRIEQGSELGGFANRPGGDGEIRAEHRIALDGHEIRELQVELVDGESLIWVEYHVANRRFARATPAQLWHAWLSLRSLRAPAADVRMLRAACVPDCDAARRNLRRYLTESGDFE
jgi:exosortase